VSDLEGMQTITVHGDAPAGEAHALGMRLAEQALAQGADALLSTVRGEFPQ